MNDDDTFERLASDYPKIQAFLKKNGEELYEALGFWPNDDDAMVLLLEKIKEHFGARFKMFKDRIDSHRCEVLAEFMDGGAINERELAGAIVLMRESYNAAITKIHRLERRDVPHGPPAPRRPPTPRRPQLWRSKA